MPDDASQPYGEHRQAKLYLAGSEAESPDIPISYAALKEAAKAAMTPEAFDYVAGGAGQERTIDSNQRAFDRWRIVPRILRDVDERDLAVELFGNELSVPFLLAPVGVQGKFHEDGDLATARAAASLDVPMVLSSGSSETIEDVAAALGEATGWFQLYWSADRDLTASFVERAEAAGYEAIVVTLDHPTTGWRERDLERGYSPAATAEGVANYVSDPAFRAALDDPPEEDPESAIRHFADVFGDMTLTWDDLAFLRDMTDLPILLKGLLHPEDAERAVEAGMDGVVVSNHGGRQIDGAIPAIDALPAVVDAVGEDLAVLFDSGIRGGSDAIRAIALGADAVLYGRPWVYGLGIAGEKGVREVVSNFRADLDLTLALAGQSSVADLDQSAVVAATGAAVSSGSGRPR